MARMTNSVGKASSDIAKDFRSLAAHAEELMAASKSASGDAVDSARSQLQDSLATLKAQIAEAETAAIEQSKAAVKASSDVIREHPLKSVAAAALFGASIGALAVALQRR